MSRIQIKAIQERKMSGDKGYVKEIFKEFSKDVKDESPKTVEVSYDKSIEEISFEFDGLSYSSYFASPSEYEEFKKELKKIKNVKFVY